MPTSSGRGHKIGAPKGTIDKLRAANERAHEAALARGSAGALATERRRQREAARAVDAAAAGSAPPPVEDAKPPREPIPPAAAVVAPSGRPEATAKRSRKRSPARSAAAGDVPPARPSLLRVLWDEGIEGLVRSRSRS